MAETQKVDVGTKNSRRVTLIANVKAAADHPAQLSRNAREVVDEALKGIDVDGFELASDEEPCGECGRMKRQIVGFEPDGSKPSTIVATVTLRPRKQEKTADFRERLRKAVAKDDRVTVLNVREG